MSDSPAELFTQDGFAEQVNVKPSDLAEASRSSTIIFVPLPESQQPISLAPPSDSAGDMQAVLVAEPVRLPYTGIYSARIAKVKQVTADIFSQLRDLKFTDIEERSEQL
jgi:hypothetical protein